MRNILKWAAITIGCLILVIAAAAWVLIGRTDQRLVKQYNVNPVLITTASDSATLARGEYWAGVLCMDCHNAGYGGRVMFDDPGLGKIYSTNLTPGKGGIGKDYAIEDWIRAIRHGVKKDGTPIFIMPSKDFNSMSQEDLSALISYMESLKPVDQVWPAGFQMKAMAKLLIAIGAFGEVISAESIDHSMGLTASPIAASNADYGKYLVDVFGCRHCHGPSLEGFQTSTPNSPYSPGLISGSEVSSWDFGQFELVMRKGIRPDGRQLSEYMPFKATAQMSEQDMQAVFNYLKSLDGTQTAMK